MGNKEMTHPVKSTLPMLSAAVSIACLIAASTLALYYPLSQGWALVGIGVAAWLATRSPLAWMVMLPALVPLMGFAPWTGWITFEEVDMLVLALACGGYWHIWHEATVAPKASSNGAPSALAWVLILALLASVIVAMMRGFADAGGFVPGWFQGYHEPMNSIRLAKSLPLALLLLPLWQHAWKREPTKAVNAFSLGLALGMAAVSLACIWERVAFTGLLNFSTDYRTTGLFWEMHVGGAALDGFLALTVPFAVRELLVARSTGRWLFAAIVLLCAGYTSLVTFSRGVYLAIPLSLVVFWALHTLQRRRSEKVGRSPIAQMAARPTGLLAGGLLVAGFGALAGWLFQTSGYRGAGLLLGVVALVLPAAQALRPLILRQWLAGTVAGALFVMLAIAITSLLPKGAYIAYGLAFSFTALMLSVRLLTGKASSMTATLAFSGLLGAAASLVLVATHWGYALATGPATVAAILCVLLTLAPSMSGRILWPANVRWQAVIICTMSLVFATIGVFSGGAYMQERFSTRSSDMQDRLHHWKLGASLLQTPADKWLGKGMGRFPANFFLEGDPTHRPGDFRLMQNSGTSYLHLTSGLFPIGWGELFRVSQRVEAPTSALTAHAQVRTSLSSDLHFEVCEKHLLYDRRCNTGNIVIAAQPDQWQVVNVPLSGDKLSRGEWYAPRLLAFSVALGSSGSAVDLKGISLTGTDGRNLLANGDFTNGLSHWFSSSDRLHMPWHIKSMYMQVLFDQGIVGLLVWGLLTGSALARLTWGSAKSNPLAPALVASLVGFGVVGLFDSLLDVPRVSLLFYLLVLVSLTLKSKPSVTHART